MKPSALFTLEASTKGVKLAIKFPDGSPTGNTITVRGTDSPEFQNAASGRAKGRVAILALPESEQSEAIESATRKLMVAVVVDWDFEGKCTPEAAEELFKNAPDVMQQVDDFCTKRGNFFTKPQKS